MIFRYYIKDEGIMKRYLFVIILCLFFTIVSAQRYFDCGLFNFQYDNTFSISEIENAPHMLLKLKNKRCYMSFSCWDYQIAENRSIWDDDIIEHYKKMSGNYISINKELVKTRSGYLRCLKTLNNLDGGIKACNYFLFNKGFLILCCIMEEGKYEKNSKTPYCDKVLLGLKLK